MSQPQQSPSRASTYYAKRRSQMSPGRPMSALYNNNNNNSGSASPPSASPGASSLVSDASTLNRNHHQQQQQQQNRMSVLLLSGVDPSTVLFSDMLSNSNNNINTQSSMSSPQDRHNATSPEELAALVSKQASELALKNKLVAELTNRNQWAMAHLHATSNEGVNMDNSNGGGEGNLNDDDDDNGKVVLMESVCVDHTHRLAQLAQLPALNQQESDEAKVKLLQTVLFFNKNLKQARLTVKENIKLLKDAELRLKESQERASYLSSLVDGIESKKDDSSTAQSQIATIVAINRARVSEIESQLHESQKTVAMLSSQAELWQRAAKRSQDARIQAEASLRTLESQVTELTGELELAKQQKSELQQQQTHILQNSSNGGDGNTSSADKQMIQDLQLQLQEALTRNEALTEAMAEASNHIQALERENTDLLVQIELKSSTEKSAEDLYNQLEQERVVHEDELKKMVMQFEELIGGGESASIQLKTRIEELEADAAKSAADSLAHESNTNERISQLEALVAELESSVSNLSERKMELQEALDLSQQTVELLQTRSSSSSEVNPSTDRGVGDDNKEQFALKVRRIEELQAEVIAIHDSREAAEEAKAAAERTSNHLMEELQARDAELVQLHEQRASASAENEQQLMEIQRQLSMEIESLEQAVEEKNDEISQLNARINELQSVSSHREEMKVQLSDKEDQIKELIHEMKESNNLINLLQEEITSSQVELQQIKLNKARQEEDEKRQLQASKESLELEQQVSLLEIRLEESKQELDLVKEQMGEKAELVDEMKVKVSALESQLEKHQQQQQQQRSLGGGESKKEAAIKAAMASELASLHSSLKEYEDRLVSERQAKDSLSAQIESLTASLAQSQEMIEVLQADLADVGNERSAHGIDLEDISVQLNQLQDKYEQMEKSKVELSAEYEIKLKETANIMADMDLQVESLKTSIKELTEQLESEASQKSILADKIESLTDEICERDGAIVELRQKLDLSVSENNNSNSSKKKSSTKEKLSKVWRSGSNSKKSGSKSTTEPPTSPLPTEQLMSPTSEPSSPPLSPVSAPITNNDIEVKELQTQLHQVIETSRREQEGLVLQMQEREDDVRILESRVKVVESQLHSALDDLIKEQNEKKRVKAKLEEALSSQLQEGEEEDPSSVVDAKNQEESKLLDILKLKKQHRMTFDELSHVNAVVEDLQRRIEELEVQIQKERHLTDQAKQLAARMEQQANELLTENESMMLYNQQLQSKLLSLTNEE